MKRVVLALASTVTGLVLLLGFKTHPTATLSAPGPAAIVAPAAGASVAATPRPTASAPAVPAAHNAPSDSAAPPAPSPTASAHRQPAPAPRTVTGGTSNTPYGPVQIQITLTGGKITAVRPLQLPNDRQRSQQIASYAVPRLTHETLAAQSAQIDMISGATYTSEGYKASLQSALDQAGIR